MDGYSEIQLPPGIQLLLEQLGEHTTEDQTSGLWIGYNMDALQTHW